jgi:hypothetical protein
MLAPSFDMLLFGKKKLRCSRARAQGRRSEQLKLDMKPEARGTCLLVSQELFPKVKKQEAVKRDPG